MDEATALGNAAVPLLVGLVQPSVADVLRPRAFVILEQLNLTEENKMAKGKKCPSCKSPMFAESEDDQPKGRYVVYVCPDKASCKHREKVFEKYAG